MAIIGLILAFTMMIEMNPRRRCGCLDAAYPSEHESLLQWSLLRNVNGWNLDMEPVAPLHGGLEDQFQTSLGKQKRWEDQDVR